MNIRKSWKVICIVLLILIVANVYLIISSGAQTDILKDTGIKTENQNTCLAYSNINKSVFVGTQQNNLIAYSDDGKELWRFAAKGSFRELKINAEESTIYAANEDRNVYILDAVTGALKKTIDTQRRILSMDILEDGSKIAVAASISTLKNYIIVYDSDGNMTMSAKPRYTVRKILFAADGNSLYTGNDHAEIIRMDLTGEIISQKDLNYEVVGIVQTASGLTVLTKNTTVYQLDEDLDILNQGAFIGEGRSMNAAEDGSWVAVGTIEGSWGILGKDLKLIASGKLADTVVDMHRSPSDLLITGYDRNVYHIGLQTIQTLPLWMTVSKFAGISLIVLSFLFLVSLVFAVSQLRTIMKRFFAAIYKHRVAYIFLIPTFTLLLFFNYIPVLIAFVRSFTDWSQFQRSTREINFIGFDNFVKMFTEGYFLVGLKNLGIIVGTSMIKVLTVPMLIAELVFMMKKPREKYWFRFLFVVPMVVPGIVNALMWQQIYDPQIGLLNQVLTNLGLENLTRVWLGDPSTAIWAVVFMGFPFINAFAFLVYYGGLIDIPSSLFEAANVDGSNGIWNFFKIHIPLIMPQFKMLIILTFIGAIQDFGGILILTGGGPGVSTYVPGLEMFYNATRFGKYGYACALGLVMFVAILICTLISNRMKSNEEYNN